MNAAELPELLACPVCQDGELLGLDEQPVDGLLSCSRCPDSWPEEVAARRRAVEVHSWERRVDEMVDIGLQA